MRLNARRIVIASATANALMQAIIIQNGQLAWQQLYRALRPPLAGTLLSWEPKLYLAISGLCGARSASIGQLGLYGRYE